MNLQENIERIHELFGFFDKKKPDVGTSKEFEISYEFNPEVVELQKILKKLGFNLGRFGKNMDGIDGKYGPITKAAHLAFKEGLKPSQFDSKKDTFVKKSISGERKNIIIGDSQVPYVDMNTSKASKLSKTPGMSSLWEGGKTVSWLIEALSQFQESPEITNVVIVIGTNGGFGKFTKDNIPLLFKQLREKFPNANFFVVQGSWGWGGLKNIQEKDVRNYYKKFAMEGAKIIEPPIGKIEPHGNNPVYAEIGSAIDNML